MVEPIVIWLAKSIIFPAIWFMLKTCFSKFRGGQTDISFYLLSFLVNQKQKR